MSATASLVSRSVYVVAFCEGCTWRSEGDDAEVVKNRARAHLGRRPDHTARVVVDTTRVTKYEERSDDELQSG